MPWLRAKELDSGMNRQYTKCMDAKRRSSAIRVYMPGAGFLSRRLLFRMEPEKGRCIHFFLRNGFSGRNEKSIICKIGLNGNVVRKEDRGQSVFPRRRMVHDQIIYTMIKKLSAVFCKVKDFSPFYSDFEKYCASIPGFPPTVAAEARRGGQENTPPEGPATKPGPRFMQSGARFPRKPFVRFRQRLRSFPDRTGRFPGRRKDPGSFRSAGRTPPAGAACVRSAR